MQPKALFRIGDERDGGSVTLVVPKMVVIAIHGQIPESMAAPIASALEAHVVAHDEIWTFWDLEFLVQYHSSLRVLCTQVLWKHRKKVRSVHAFAKSKLVRMGVAVADLALGGIITTHATRAPFAAALEKVKRQLAVIPDLHR